MVDSKRALDVLLVEMPETCQWTHHVATHGIETACGKTWRVCLPDNVELDAKFCPHCGLPVEVER